MGKEFEREMIKKMDAIISILMNPSISQTKMVEKVKILKNHGIGYREISTILGSSPKSVSVMFAKINKENG